MVKFKPRRVDRNNYNTPIMYDKEIDEYAHAILKDYKPNLLREPGKMDFQYFLESYLGATIIYHDIYSDDPNRPILAMTAFEKGCIRVFDREDECVKRVFVPERAVIIDNAVMESGKEGLALFSGFHEAGHIALHWEVFSAMVRDGAEFGASYESGFKGDVNCEFADEFGDMLTVSNASVVCCRRGNIESMGRGRTERTASDWREHQADYFAAAIAMPNTTFIPFVRNILRENGYYKATVTTGRDGDLDILVEDIIPDAISETYGVSKRAAGIKLRKAGFVHNHAK